jgi:hypothetical protein
MAILKIIRINQFINYFRKIRLYLDGNFLYTISNGEIKELEISDGEHTLEARIDWTSSNKIIFNSNKNEIITLELGSKVLNPMSILLAALRFLLFISALIISIHYNNYFIFWTILLLLIAWYVWEIVRKKGSSVVFFLTAGRRDYLYLKHI